MKGFCERMSMLAHALAYGRIGWKVFPLRQIIGQHCDCRDPDCVNVGKHPRVAWSTKATSNAEAIEQFWGYNGGYLNDGIGLACGNGCPWALDIDPRHGGDASLAALEALHGALPPTPVALTGSGGLHYFFQDPGPEYRNTASVIGPGIDSRGIGGYVVLTPTLHKSGNRYSWKIPPGRVPLAVPPDWLLKLAKTGASASIVVPKKKKHSALHTTPPSHDDTVTLLAVFGQLPIITWAVENPEAVSREVWRGIATNIACIVKDTESAWPNGERLFHEISEDDERYNAAQTTKTFLDAIKSAQNYGPMLYPTMTSNGAPAEICSYEATMHCTTPVAHARHLMWVAQNG